MQQTSLLLDINDLPPIKTLGTVDHKQLEAFIELCRASDRPDLAAPYAGYLWEDSCFDERPYEIWFDAIRNDDIFLVKAIVSSGFDINSTFEYTNDDDDAEFGSAITLALANNSSNVLSYLLELPRIDINIVGYTLSDYDYQTLANPLPTDDYIIPFLMLLRSKHSSCLKWLKFDVDIRWGRNNDRSALIIATENNDFEMTEWLLYNKSNPNQLLERDESETLFGRLVGEYLQKPTPDKFKLIELMLEHGASILASDWEDIPVYINVWWSQNQALIDLFKLDYLKNDLEHQNVMIWMIKDRCREIELREKERANNTIDYSMCYAINATKITEVIPPVLEASILTELRALCPLSPGPWISDVRLKQTNDSLRIIICQDVTSPIEITEIILPGELIYNTTPDVIAEIGDINFKSCLEMILTIISRPAEWWHEVERYLRCFGITLFDEYFYQEKLKEYTYSN